MAADGANGFASKIEPSLVLIELINTWRADISVGGFVSEPNNDCVLKLYVKYYCDLYFRYQQHISLCFIVTWSAIF